MTDSNPHHALYELAYRYAQAVDRRDWPPLATLFTSDASLASPGFRLDDRDAIVAGMGDPKDVANLVLFLASDESRFVKGAELRIDNAQLVSSL